MTIKIKDGCFSGRQGMRGSKAISVTTNILMFPQRKAAEYQTEIKSKKARKETRLQATGCEATPEPSPLLTRIIPFPVMRHTETETPAKDFQTQLDDFLRDMGYIE
jgi:hypothetical protein